MVPMKLTDYAEAMLDACDEASMKTDAGVQAVTTYLLKYSSLSIDDLASITGFTETKVRDDLFALGDQVESDGGAWRPSARGRAKIEHAFATAVGTMGRSSARAASSLTAAEARRWKEVKRIVMDTVPGMMYTKSLREQFTHYFHFVDTTPPKTLDEAYAERSVAKPGEIDASCTFKNQGIVGLTVHRPGTQPAVEFCALIKLFQESEDDCLVDSDGPLINKALAAGLTFW